MHFSGSPGKARAASQGLTLPEVIFVVAILGVLAVILLPGFAAANRKAASINCVNNLKECGLASKIWEGNHNDRYPGETSITNGGATELLAAGNVAACFQVISNELSTPKILTCPSDDERVGANSWGGLNNSNISYFVGSSASDSCPQLPLLGDDNFATDGVPVKSGVLNLSTNRSILWTAKRHHFGGNIGLADGSVEQVSSDGLTNALGQVGGATSWVVIP
jgi:prepilin-type N-terminal cleavage/methylation domain-containing protein